MSKQEEAMYRRNLPHLRIQNATYFVTWRLRAGVRELAPEERTLVVNALKYFDGERYALWSYVVMNDHVHVIVEPAGEWRLRAILHSWKSFTAHAIQRRRQKRGTLWQDESFDRVVRDEKELHDKNAYILGNPGKRWPALQTYPWVSVWS